MATTPPAPTRPAHDALGYERRPLDALFAPKSIAVVGATDAAGSLGHAILRNLNAGSAGARVYAVSPPQIQPADPNIYSTVQTVPGTVDLAVIVTPAETVPAVIDDCVAAGVRGAIVISAGFRERGPAGVALEQDVLARARRGQLRLLGPNCLGVLLPHTGLNTTFLTTKPRPGSLGLISQSGALGAAILDWGAQENIGFSAFISVGSMLDIGWGDLIDYLGDDPNTAAIALYMETIGDARSFLSAAREVALTKPIIVIKAGRTPDAASVAQSHTGVLAGSDAVLDAAFRRCGVLRIETLGHLFSMVAALAKQPRPRGPRLTIITNAGGPAILATDTLIERGGELARLPQTAHDALDTFLPPHWSHANPIDLLGDAGPDRWTRALDIAINDPGSDGVLAIFAPQGITSPEDVAREVVRYTGIAGKPLLASWMGGEQVVAADEILNKANIPTFPYPDTAARIFCNMWRYTYNLRALYETPVLPPETEDIAEERRRVDAMVQTARESGRTLLTEVESKQLLAAYGIPTVTTQSARSVDEAVVAAEMIGYPVVVKLLSETITHKTDVGGVHLNLLDAAAVRRAYGAIKASVTSLVGAEHFLGVTVQPMIAYHGYELIIGSTTDPQFGPMLLFGAGGRLVEILDDSVLALPPLNTTLARRMMEQTRVYRGLRGDHGRLPVDLGALDQLMVRFSRLVVEQRWIKEIDINPLLAAVDGLMVLDARIVLHAPELTEAQLPRLAIRPYPSQYVEGWTTKDGTPVVIRPIRAEDEPLMVKFHQTLSESSVYTRYFHMIKLDQRIAHERLTRICFIDYDREMALVAERTDPVSGEREIMGVGRLSKLRSTPDAEFALLISDKFQKHGLGTELLRRLVVIGRDEQVRAIVATILPENRGMQVVAKKIGFRLQHDWDEGVINARLDLAVQASA